MISHVWTVICSRVVVDKESNNLSIQNVLERVTIHGEPMPDTLLPMPFDLVTMWTRVAPDIPARGIVRMQMQFPSGKVYESHEAEVNVLEHLYFRFKIHFAGLPMAEAGRHLFVVELKNEDTDEWQRVAAVPLQLTFKPPEEEPEEDETAED